MHKKKEILSPLKSVRKYCVNKCMTGQPNEVKLCQAEDCSLYGLRFGKNPYHLRVLEKIREKCFDCSGYSSSDVRDCEHTNCELYPYRMGKNPNRAGIGKSAEEMKTVRETRLQSVEI